MEGFVAVALDAVFPPRCVACETDGAWLCNTCLHEIELIGVNPCARCGTISREHECDGGDAENNLDGMIAVGFYHDPRMRALLHGLKYQYATCLLPSITEIVRRWKVERREPWPWAGVSQMGIQAVVGAPGRVRERGFDQAELMADIFRAEIVPWAQPVALLQRVGSVGAQADLEPGPLRQANVAGVFELVNGAKSPETVLLVDDVFTTGATMFEAARVMRAAGVHHVYGAVLALGA